MDFISEHRQQIAELEAYIKLRDYNKNDLIMILHRAQRIFGYLPEEVQRFIARQLRIPAAKVFGIVTFYSFFNTERKGRYTIDVCLGTACFVKGADKVLEAFEKELGIRSGETTNDGKFTIDSLRCVGACGLAPVVTVNGKVYGKVVPAQVQSILKACEDAEVPECQN